MWPGSHKVVVRLEHTGDPCSRALLHFLQETEMRLWTPLWSKRDPPSPPPPLPTGPPIVFSFKAALFQLWAELNRRHRNGTAPQLWSNQWVLEAHRSSVKTQPLTANNSQLGAFLRRAHLSEMSAAWAAPIIYGVRGRLIARRRYSQFSSNYAAISFPFCLRRALQPQCARGRRVCKSTLLSSGSRHVAPSRFVRRSRSVSIRRLFDIVLKI